MEYKYFVAFTYYGKRKRREHGNCILNVNCTISDLNSDEEMMEWIKTLQSYVEEKRNIKGVIVNNFQLIN